MDARSIHTRSPSCTSLFGPLTTIHRPISTIRQNIHRFTIRLSIKCKIRVIIYTVNSIGTLWNSIGWRDKEKKLTESKTISSVQETSPLRETLETIVDGHYGTFTFSYTCDASDHVVCLEVAVSSDPINWQQRKTWKEKKRNVQRRDTIHPNRRHQRLVHDRKHRYHITELRL